MNDSNKTKPLSHEADILVGEEKYIVQFQIMIYIMEKIETERLEKRELQYLRKGYLCVALLS